MTTALWAALLAAAALWPARLTGALDGAPLDAIAEVVLVGVVLPLAIWLAPGVLAQRRARVTIVALLAWKAFMSAALVQDGWCLRFTSPVAIFVDELRVPHSWDVRADWRSNPPQCSAVMTRGYHSLNEFPAWFYNLPPNDFKNPARQEEQPPYVTPAIAVDGVLTNAVEGRLAVAAGDATIEARIDDRIVDAGQLQQGVLLAPGRHRIAVAGTLQGGNWSLVPTWNGAGVFTGGMATMRDPSALDRAIRPWGRFISPLLILAVIGFACVAIADRARQPLALAWLVVAVAALAVVGAVAPVAAVRAAPLLLATVAFLPLRDHLRNAWGALLLIGVPFMALLTAFHVHEAGVFTWYSVGDDFWMYQRYAYRIFLQGYWLEGGQPTFWFQPLYRWIAGALHMIFGDSSVGEALWDAACVVAAATFAFVVTEAVTGFRWAVAAMLTALFVLTVGPMWYLIGRGLAEISSMGFLALAALLALRGRDGSWRFIVASGVCATLAFYARLNNLPMTMAVLLFAWPLQFPVRQMWQAARIRAAVSPRVFLGAAAVIIIGLLLFAARTYYYTGVFSVLYGTQASARSVWQTTDEGLTPFQNVTGSFLTVVTMADPPRLDPRGIPILVGLLFAVLSVLRIRPFDRLPANAIGLGLAGFVGALVARGSAYPGRFSAHVIPVACAITISGLALLLRAARERARS